MPVPIPMPKSVAPTDNLYKFAALFGLALIVVAAVLLSIHNERYNEKILANYIEDVVAAASSQPASAGTMPADSIARTKAHAELAAEKILLTAETKDYSLLLYFGAGISFVGFAGWYFRVQKYQDELLKVKVKRELASLEKPLPDDASEEGAVAEEEE